MDVKGCWIGASQCRAMLPFPDPHSSVIRFESWGLGLGTQGFSLQPSVMILSLGDFDEKMLRTLRAP